MRMTSSLILDKFPNRQTIKKNGWQQGSCLFVDEHNPLFTQGYVEKTGLHVVMTQHCDLLHDSFDAEPQVELLYTSHITKANNQYIGGKNPRILHLPIITADNIQYYECLIKNKCSIDRELLLRLSPSEKYILPEKTLKSLITWITKRYNRTAFPDSFNNRIYRGKNKEKMQKLLESHTDDVHGLFTILSTNKELNEGEIYEIKLYLLLEDHADNTDEKFTDTLEKIVRLIEPNNDIHVNEYRVSKLNGIDASRYLNLSMIDFDYLSYQD